jgi:chromosome segregation ATPase
MSRGGVNLATVKQAKEALEARGIYPSVEAVREHLRGGSPNTILKYLRELKNRDAGLFGELGMVSQELSGLVLQLHNTLHKEAQETIDAAVAKVTTAFEEKISALNLRLEESLRDGKALAAENEGLKGRLTTSEGVTADLNKKYNAATTEIARLETLLSAAKGSLSESEERNQKLERDLKNARERHDAYEDAVLQERGKLLDAHSRETLALQESMREKEDVILRRDEQISDLNVKIGALDIELSSVKREMKRHLDDLDKATQRCEQQEARVDELRITMAGMEATAVILKEQHAQANDRYEAKSTQLSIAQAELERIRTELAEMTAKLAQKAADGSSPPKATKAPKGKTVSKRQAEQ